MDKKWVIGIISSVIIIPSLVLGWKNIQAVWAAPDSIKSVQEKVDKTYTAQEQIAQMVIEQKSRQDKQEAISNLQVQALKEQLSLVSELKKK